MVHTHPKLATISDILHVFNEIALNPVDFPLPLSMLSMQDFPVDFAAVTTLKWGEGKRKAKMSENEKSQTEQ